MSSVSGNAASGVNPGSFVVGVEAGQRLDLALVAHLPQLSRTQIQRLIDSGQVRVNGAAARPGRKLEPGEIIGWTLPEPERVPPSLQPEAIPLTVIFEDEHLLVIDKPAGLVVHPAPGHPGGTLVNAVLAHAGDDLTGIGGVERPGIVHRLDRDTTGLMVVAKTEPAYRSLQAQIAERTAERRYLALVRGQPRFENAQVDAPIGRHPVDRQRMAVIAPGSPHNHREARTDLRVLERFPGFALLEARLHTGRTHQVRVHCAYAGLPVVGDPIYGAGRAARAERLPTGVAETIAALPGQALHAWRLAFDHPRDGKRLEFSVPPHAPLCALLSALGSTGAARNWAFVP
jgi:23S rRNA pseudouridine1911/1915/1917 synthase